MAETKKSPSPAEQSLIRVSDEEYRRSILARLTVLQTEWERGGPNPWLANSLSTTEYVMLAIVAGKEQELRGTSPVTQFLLLQDWQQRWILERRGLQALVGTIIG